MNNISEQNDIVALKKAFELFNQTTSQLQSSYRILEERVRSLNKELEERNIELNQKVSELDHTKKYLANVLYGMHNGVIAVDINGNITVFNPAAQSILGFDSQDELMGNRILFESLIVPMREVLQGKKEGSNGKKRIELEENKRLSLEEHISLIKDNNGEIVGVVNVFQDLSKIEALEDEIRRVDRLKALGEMAATVAHEIRNPLSGIEGFASLLARDLDQNSPIMPLAKNIIQGTRSLNNIVANLLYFTRPLQLQKSNTDIIDLVQRCMFFVNEEIKKENKPEISIDLELKQKTIIALIDPEQVKQVLLNILFNAVQAVSHSGKISVVLESTNSEVCIRILDNGEGINKTDMEKIFNPFFTTKTTGTGLGLAISKKIIDAHQGRIEVNSAIGKGTSFNIILPESDN